MAGASPTRVVVRGDGRVLRNSTSGADWAGAESSAGLDMVDTKRKRVG